METLVCTWAPYNCQADPSMGHSMLLYCLLGEMKVLALHPGPKEGVVVGIKQGDFNLSSRKINMIFNNKAGTGEGKWGSHKAN